MEPSSNYNIHQFHEKIDSYLDSAEKGQLSEEELLKFHELIAKTPLAVTDREKARLVALQKKDSPLASKMSDVFNQIIVMVANQENKDALTNPSFMHRLLKYLPLKETTRLSQVSKSLQSHTDQKRIKHLSTDRDSSWLHHGIADRETLLRFLSRKGNQLRSLNLIDIKISNSNLSKIIHFSPHLTSLALSGEANDNYVDMVSLIAKGLPQLISLRLTDCPSMKDDELKVIIDGLPKLNSLTLEGCSEISASGLLMIPKGLPQLTTLGLTDNMSVCTSVLQELAKGLSELRLLNISSNEHISGVELLAITHGFPKLTSLNVKDCGKINNEELKAIIQGLKQLKQFSYTWQQLSLTQRELRKVYPHLKTHITI